MIYTGSQKYRWRRLNYPKRESEKFRWDGGVFGIFYALGNEKPTPKDDISSIMVLQL